MPKRSTESGAYDVDYTLLLDASGDDVATESIERLLRSEGGSRTLVFIVDQPGDDPLARFADDVARCEAEGIEIVVRTSAEQEHLEASDLLAINRKNLASPGSDAAIDAATRAGPQPAAELPGTDALADGFVQPQDLPPGPSPSVAPGGPMAAHLGDRLSVDALTDEDRLMTEEIAARIRAWSVPSLIGTVFVAEEKGDVARALQAHVQRHLGVPVRVSAREVGSSKYMHVHTSASTPPDPSTGQPMFLELYGHIARVGEHDLRTLEGARWQRALRQQIREHRGVTRLSGPLVIRLETVTWANVSYPGFRVPFYM